MDLKLRNWLLTTVVGLLLSVGSCYGRTITADVETLKKENSKRQVETATTKQAVDDFRKDFDEFKKDIKDDIASHHSRNR
jgi:hypothetical protein